MKAIKIITIITLAAALATFAAFFVGICTALVFGKVGVLVSTALVAAVAVAMAAAEIKNLD